jgi:chromate reductase
MMVRSANGDRLAAPTGRVIRILGISGSLRGRSSNTELLRAASLLAPSDVRVALFSGLDALPYFNPDLDGAEILAPPRIRDFRHRVRRADALLLCSPEYAHGSPAP